MAGITANELIDPSVLKTLEKLNKELKNTLGILGDLTKQQKATNEELKKGAKTNDDLAKNKEKVNKSTKVLTEQERNLIKIQQQEQKVIEQVTGSYNQMNAQLNAARLRYKNMSDEERKSKFGQQTLKTIQNLDSKLKDFDKTMGQAGRQVGFYERAWSKAQSVFLMFTGALAAGGIVVKGFNMLLSSSESLSDRWAITLGGLRSGMDFFLKSLSSANFENFWQGLRNAVDAGREYAKVLDELEDRQIALKFKQADARVEYVKNMQVVKDATKAESERIKAAQNIINLEQKLATESKKIAEDKYNSLLKTTAKANGITQEQLIKFINTDKEYVANIENLATSFENKIVSSKLKAQQELSSVPGITSEAIRQAQIEIEKQIIKSDPIGKQAFDTLRKLNNITADTKNEITSAYDELQNVTVDFLEKTTKPQIRLNDLLAEGKNKEVKDNEEANKKKFEDDKKYYDQARALKENELKILKESQQESLNEYEQNIQRRINLASEEFINSKRSAESLSDEMLSIQLEELEAKLDYAKQNGISTLEIETRILEAKKQLKDSEIEYYRKIEDDKQKKAQETAELEKEILDKKVELFNAGFDLFNSLAENEASNYEAQKERELKSAGDNTEKKEEIETRYQAKIAQVRRRQAIVDKTQSIFNIGINTAQAIMKTSAQVGFPAAIPLIALTAALGAVQTAAVLAKPIPKFAKGVKNLPETTLAEVGEIGRELIKTKEGEMFLTPDRATKMVLPKGASVLTHAETEKYIQTNGIDNEKFDILISEQKKTRQMLANKKQSNLNITQKGWEYSVERANSKIKYIDRYFRN